MNRVLRLDPSGRLERIDQESVVLGFAEAAPDRWLLELYLMETGLNDVLTVVAAGEFRVQVAMDERIDRSERAKCRWRPDLLELFVSRTELESWRSFFLRYYRDGIAEVDHLDVEASALESGGPGAAVVLKVDRARPPMSGDELRTFLERARRDSE